MRALSEWVGLVLLVSLTGPVSAQTTLKWQFKEGDRFFLENVTTTKQAVMVLGNKVPMESTNTSVSSFKVLKASAEEVVLEQKIEDARVKGGLGAQAGLIEKMVGAVFTITLNDKGEVTKIAGLEALLKKLSEENDEVSKLLKTILTEETLKQGLQEAFGFTPGKPVNQGESWTRKMALSMGPIGSFQVDQQYTFVGKTNEGVQLAIKSDFAYAPPKGDAGGDGVLPFKVTKGEFKTEEAKGTLLFDADKGRLVRQEFQAKLKGALTISVGGQEAPMELQQEINTKVRLLDKWLKDL